MRDFVTPVDFRYGIFRYIDKLIVDFANDFVPEMMEEHVDHFVEKLFEDGAPDVDLEAVELVHGDAVNGGRAVGTVEDNRDLSRNGVLLDLTAQLVAHAKNPFYLELKTKKRSVRRIQIIC
jgi:hypothetical protein